MIREVKVFETDDGKVFGSKELAENYDYVSKKLNPADEWKYNDTEKKFVKTVYDWTISADIIYLKVVARNYDQDPYFDLTKLESAKKNNFDWEYSRGVEYLYSLGINNLEDLVSNALKMVEYLK